MQTRSEEIKEQRALRAIDGMEAMAEYLAETEAVRVRTARLKLLRLERDALHAGEVQKAAAQVS